MLRRLAGPAGPPDTVVLLLHGGDESANTARVPPWWPPALRMLAFGPAIRRARPAAAVYLLWNAGKGWSQGGPPVRDARWALGELRRLHPGTPIVLGGHSMGGRVGARVLADPDVAGLVGLAPWLPAGEPVPDLTGRAVVLLHGEADRTIAIADTRQWAARAGGQGCVNFLAIDGGDHPMLRHFFRWHRLAARGVVTIAAGRPSADPVDNSGR